MKSSKGLFLALVVSLFLISACSTTQQAYMQNISLYFDSKVNVTISNEQIIQSPVDLIFVKNGERAYATMALGFIENGQYKWLSRDDVMLMTENGRLVRTIGLKHNLTYVSNLPLDPLKRQFHGSEKPQWNSVIDTEFGDFGANLSSEFSIVSDELITVQKTEFITTMYVESVIYQSKIHGEGEWKNYFWFDQSTGQLLKSLQKASLQSEIVEITYISRAIRLLEK